MHQELNQISFPQMRSFLCCNKFFVHIEKSHLIIYQHGQSSWSRFLLFKANFVDFLFGINCCLKGSNQIVHLHLAIKKCLKTKRDKMLLKKKDLLPKKVFSEVRKKRRKETVHKQIIIYLWLYCRPKLKYKRKSKSAVYSLQTKTQVIMKNPQCSWKFKKCFKFTYRSRLNT